MAMHTKTRCPGSSSRFTTQQLQTLFFASDRLPAIRARRAFQNSSRPSCATTDIRRQQLPNRRGRRKFQALSFTCRLSTASGGISRSSGKQTQVRILSLLFIKHRKRLCAMPLVGWSLISAEIEDGFAVPSCGEAMRWFLRSENSDDLCRLFCDCCCAEHADTQIARSPGSEGRHFGAPTLPFFSGEVDENTRLIIKISAKCQNRHAVGRRASDCAVWSEVDSHPLRLSNGQTSHNGGPLSSFAGLGLFFASERR